MGSITYYLTTIFCLASLKGALGGWRLTFSDDFTGSQLNTSIWNVGGDPTRINGEFQYYSPDSFGFDGNNLVIKAEFKRTDTVKWGTYNFTSGRIMTKYKWSQKYGYFEMRSRHPLSTIGTWPAFWLMPNNGYSGKEIDIIEQIASDPWGIKSDYAYLHFICSYNPHTGPGTSVRNASYASGWHKWAVQWIPGNIYWYIDDILVWNTNHSCIPNTPAYMIANLAIGGSWPSPPNNLAQYPALMEIDYIRAYEYVASGGVSLPGPGQGIAYTEITEPNTRLYFNNPKVVPETASPGNVVTFSVEIITPPDLVNGIAQVQFYNLTNENIRTFNLDKRTFPSTISVNFTIPMNQPDGFINVALWAFNSTWGYRGGEQTLATFGVNRVPGQAAPQITTAAPTTQEITSQALTTGLITTKPLTTQALTTKPLTTKAVTTKPLTTRALTTKPLTTQALTTQPLTTQELTTQPLTTAPLTTGTFVASAYFVCGGDPACEAFVSYNQGWSVAANQLSPGNVRVVPTRKYDGFRFVLTLNNGQLSYSCNLADSRCQPWLDNNVVSSTSTSGYITRVNFTRLSDGMSYAIEILSN
eukprot:TRINITY_DN956_c0_g2_i1.p1 TRINITY_DN956_c0_g2~~TRINITY_DN956_c0_g2_i1.p1  ORF type:complete len:585 (+),score=101.11 TRINITY_DN956_c0_g2_i1:3-1757(+)